jgi:hypothetical protein
MTTNSVNVIDNGTTRFVVKLSSVQGPGVADVAAVEYNDDDTSQLRLWRKVKYSRAFVGMDPDEETRGKKNPEWWHGGSSVLLETGPRKYVWIGEEVIGFETGADVVKFVSMMGRSAVPYPWAVDSDGNVYLMLERVMLKPPMGTQDPYQHYYRKHLITPDMAHVPPMKPAKSPFNKITAFYIDGEQYTLTYRPFPSKDYDRIRQNIGRKFLVKYANGKSEALAKREYVQLMDSFGEWAGFHPMPVRVLKKRS